jgi:hypothetical protein
MNIKRYFHEDLKLIDGLAKELNGRKNFSTRLKQQELRASLRTWTVKSVLRLSPEKNCA